MAFLIVAIVFLLIGYVIGRLSGERVQTEQTQVLLGGKPLAERYSELVMAVGNKYPNETRHETALRYIKEREQSSAEPQKAKEKQ